MPTIETRRFLPAMANPSLLRWYDPLGKLIGVKDMHWLLVAQAGLEPGATVLEIGCGPGNVLLLAKRVAPEATVIGLDPDAEALAMARTKAAAAGVELRLDQGFADVLPYADGSVDRVLSSLMLHHVPLTEQLAAMREARRVLAPGGRLHLLDFDHDPRTSSPLVKLMGLLPGHKHGHGHAGHGHGHEQGGSAGHGHGNDGHGHGHAAAHDRAATTVDGGHTRTPAAGHGAASTAHADASAGDGYGVPASIPALLTEAGFTDVRRTGSGSGLMGSYAYYRATAPSAH